MNDAGISVQTDRITLPKALAELLKNPIDLLSFAFQV